MNVRRLTEDIFNRISAKFNPNLNPNSKSNPNPKTLKHKHVFGKTK